jgi:hypothetical protein
MGQPAFDQTTSPAGEASAEGAATA